jgi:hypothetical protein
MKHLIQVRKYEDKQTLSTVFVLNESGDLIFKCYLIELPWLNNLKRKSCIPESTYIIEKRKSHEDGSRFGYDHLEVLDVPNRFEIKWHIANYVRDLLGCGGPGLDKADIDNDGLIDVTSSRLALETLIHHLDFQNKLTIISINGNNKKEVDSSSEELE